jgi:hypothetical protein
MSPSRTARLYFLLILDILFFGLEISIGKSSYFSGCSLYLSTHQVMLLVLSPSSQTAFTCSSMADVSFFLSIYKLMSLSSDVVSIIIALYAIKVSYLCRFALIKPANLEIAHCKLNSKYPILLRLAQSRDSRSPRQRCLSFGPLLHYNPRGIGAFL